MMRSAEPRDPFRDLLRPELAALKAYVPVPTRSDVIRLDANESPHPLPPEARELLGRALAEVPLHRYPDVRATRLRELVAERESVHPDQIVFGCGSDEVIALTLNALARPRAGREKAAVLFPDPTFVMFRMSALALGLEPVGVALDDRWDLEVDSMRDALERTRPNVVFLPSPNNPTGNLFSPARLDAVIAHARESLVVLDEAYGPFARVHYRDAMRSNAHVGRLQTLSKLGLAAARVGWAILPVELAREVDKVRQPYNFNALSQRAAELCLTSLAPFFDATVTAILHERERLARGLGAITGVTVSPSASNFLWVELPVDAGEVHARLLARGVLVRSFHAAGPRLARRVRITVGASVENDALLSALAACL
jgi:histidinol-phosphate aminotransferase